MGGIKPMKTLEGHHHTSAAFACLHRTARAREALLSVFFNPGTFLFLFLGYGVPVLLIREFVVRYNFGLAGTFALGMAYGVFNEGFLAKTMILGTTSPFQPSTITGIF